MTTLFFFLLCTIVIPILLNEFGELCPWLAKRIVRWAARSIGDPDVTERYLEEYLANLEQVPGKLSRLLAAFGYAANVPRMRRVIRAEHRGLALFKDQVDRLTTVDLDDFTRKLTHAAEVIRSKKHLPESGRTRRRFLPKWIRASHVPTRYCCSVIILAPTWDPSSTAIKELMAAQLNDHNTDSQRRVRNLINKGRVLLFLCGLELLSPAERATTICAIVTQWTFPMSTQIVLGTWKELALDLEEFSFQPTRDQLVALGHVRGSWTKRFRRLTNRSREVYFKRHVSKIARSSQPLNPSGPDG